MDSILPRTLVEPTKVLGQLLGDGHVGFRPLPPTLHARVAEVLAHTQPGDRGEGFWQGQRPSRQGRAGLPDVSPWRWWPALPLCSGDPLFPPLPSNHAVGVGMVTVPQGCWPSAPGCRTLRGSACPPHGASKDLQKPLERGGALEQGSCCLLPPPPPLRAGVRWSDGAPKYPPGGSLPRYLVVMKYGVCIHVLPRGHVEPQFPHEVHLVGERHGGPWPGGPVSTKAVLRPSRRLDLCSPPLLVAWALLPPPRTPPAAHAP